MSGGEPINGGRVTTRELYNALQHQNKERQDMERRIITKMDDVCDSVSRHDERIKRNEQEVDNLRTSSNVKDVAVGVAAAVASAIAAAIGVRN
ncbi:MAG: hypothetical protein ACYSUV_20565 [Planctomycetota bacterium]|jgi:hypothetical protein